MCKEIYVYGETDKKPVVGEEIIAKNIRKIVVSDGDKGNQKFISAHDLKGLANPSTLEIIDKIIRFKKVSYFTDSSGGEEYTVCFGSAIGFDSKIKAILKMQP